LVLKPKPWYRCEDAAERSAGEFGRSDRSRGVPERLTPQELEDQLVQWIGLREKNTGKPQKNMGKSMVSEGFRFSLKPIH
jgi:hypothetical protein